MNRIKFYLDEHISKAVTLGLLARGVEALNCVDVGMMGRADTEHLTYALNEGYVVVTRDNDFLILHSSGTKHAGIAFISRNRTTGEIISGLMLIHEVLSQEDMFNHIEFI